MRDLCLWRQSYTQVNQFALERYEIHSNTTISTISMYNFLRSYFSIDILSFTLSLFYPYRSFKAQAQ